MWSEPWPASWDARYVSVVARKRKFPHEVLFVKHAEGMGVDLDNGICDFVTVFD
jgi:hypothetical protein